MIARNLLNDLLYSSEIRCANKRLRNLLMALQNVNPDVMNGRENVQLASTPLIPAGQQPTDAQVAAETMHFHTVKKLKGEKATLLIVLKSFKVRLQNAFFSYLDLDSFNKQSCTQG
jgi:hypothetical protein